MEEKHQLETQSQFSANSSGQDDSKAISNITVHAMPEKFRNKSFVSSGSAKKTGFLILLVGVLFLGASMYAAYYFLLKQKPGVNEPGIINSKTPSPVKVEEKQEETAEKNNFEIENSIATSTVSTTSEQIFPETVPTAATSSTVATTSTPGVGVASSSSHEAGLLTPDSDNDGINDKEEALFGTSSTTPDSDGDGYDDLAEFSKLYNPVGTGKLEDNKKFSRYINSNFKYSFLYPVSFKVASMSEGESLMINISENSFFQIVAQQIKPGQSLEDWYKEQFADTPLKTEQIIYTPKARAIKAPDQSVYYIAGNNNYIFILSYTALNNNYDYPQSLKLILNSFENL